MKTKFKSKLLSILLVLVMVLALVPFASLTAFAEDEENVLASAIVTIPIPEDGETATGGKIFDSEKYNVSIGWSTTADGSVANDFTNQTFVAGNTYYVDVYLVAEDPYIFADGATVLVNGVAYPSVWTVGEAYKKYVAVYDIPFTAVEHVEKDFTVKPTGATVGLNESYEITWQTNFEADEYKVLRYNVNTAQWETQATVAYKAGVNSCKVTSNIATAHLFKVQAFKNGQMVLESSQIDVIWSNAYRVSYLANGGSGEMDVVFVDSGKYTLGWCSFVPPEGYRFSHWTISGQSYGQLEDITVTESIVVVANWLPVVTCLPLEIDGRAIGGAKTPEAARLKGYLEENDQIKFCSGQHCCGMTYASDTWYDAETKQPATEFVNGKTYFYHVGIHPKNGYLLPDFMGKEYDYADIANVTGILWYSISASAMSQDNIDKKCYEVDFYIVYDEEKGIPIDDCKEIDGIHIDGSDLSGAKAPAVIDQAKLESDIFYLCSSSCTDCEAWEFNQKWIDFKIGNLAGSFIDGHQYVFYLILHLKPGYKSPEKISENLITVDGVAWEATMTEGNGTGIMWMGMITYHEDTGIPHACAPKLVEKVEPTCTENGLEKHYECFCGKSFEDAEGKVEIPDLVAWGAIDATGHDYGTTWKNDADNHWNECACGDKANVAPHADTDNNGKCDTCEYQMSTTPNNPDNPNDTPDNPNNTPDNPNNTPDDPTDDKDGLGAGAIVGIVIGSALVAGVGGFALFWFVIKKKSFADLIAVFKKK